MAWFKERSLTEITLGGLLILVVIRTIQFNMTRMRVRVAAVVAGGGGGGGGDSNHPVQHDQDEGMCRCCCSWWWWW